MGMVRFSDKEDKGYEMLKEDVEELIAGADNSSRDPVVGV